MEKLRELLDVLERDEESDEVDQTKVTSLIVLQLFDTGLEQLAFILK